MPQNSSLCSYNHEAIPRQHKEVPCSDNLHIALKLLCYPALLSSHTCILFTQMLVAKMTSEKSFGSDDICQRRLQVITTSKEGKPRVLSCSPSMGLFLWPQTSVQLDVTLSEMKLWYVKLTTIFNYTDFFSSPLHPNN
jgi:hypothetical protein